jgi:cell wall-associated NlpC family hydrolase
MALEGLAAIQARIALLARSVPARPVAAPPRDETAAFGAALARATAPRDVVPAPAGSTAVAREFLDVALAQEGKPYVYAATAATSDPDPDAFDCSELTKWAAARAGLTIPDGATAQYLHARDHGTTMSVEEALRTPGALLFHFSHEPRDLSDIPPDGHVAISVGDGVHTIEARGRKYGTGVFDATGSRAPWFNFAAKIPGM